MINVNRLFSLTDAVLCMRACERLLALPSPEDMEYLKRAVDQEKLEVKKNPTMKLSALFTATVDKVEQMLTNNLPVRDGEWSTPEVRGR